MSRARSSSPQRVADLLTVAVPGLSERLLEATVRREWKHVVPAALAQRSEAGELRHGILEVRVDNSPWLQELSMRSAEVLATLTARYGAAVQSLRLSLASLRAPEPVHGSPRPGRSTAARLGAEDAREVDALAAALPDAELAHALRRLLTKDRLARGRAGTPASRERTT